MKLDSVYGIEDFLERAHGTTCAALADSDGVFLCHFEDRQEEIGEGEVELERVAGFYVMITRVHEVLKKRKLRTVEAKGLYVPQSVRLTESASNSTCGIFNE